MAEDFLWSFSHPNQWDTIFNTIIEKLGPKFYEWAGGVDFTEEGSRGIMVIYHQDKKQAARINLNDITGAEPAIAGGWFTVLRIKKAVVFAAARNNCVRPDEVTDDTEVEFVGSSTRNEFFESLFQELGFSTTIYKEKPTIREIVDTLRSLHKAARQGI